MTPKSKTSKSGTSVGDIGPSEFDVSEQNITALLTKLHAFLDDLSIITDSAQCYERSSNEWAHIEKGKQPAVVVLPQSTDEVSQICRACNELRVPVTSCSGRTSTTGALWSTRGGLCVDFQRMNNVLEIRTDDLDAEVEAGVEWRDLASRLEPHGLFFPPDPGPGACIGGMVSTSCAGTNAYRYGTMKEWVISLEVVLADGTVVTTKRRPRKSSNGYDLTHLLIGSEGTLGLVTKAVIRLSPLPLNQKVAIAVFSEPREAMRTGVDITKSGVQLDALELLDHNSMKAINKSKHFEREWTEKPTLFMKLSGHKEGLDQQFKAVRDVAESHGCMEFEVAKDSKEARSFWDVRKGIASAVYDSRDDPDAQHLTTDSAVPISRVADLMEESYKLLDKAGVPGHFVIHLGDGNLHCVVLASSDKLEIGRKLTSDIEKLALDMDGTISGEHGIGYKHTEELVYELGQNAIDMMRSIKIALDPHRILNPDKIFTMESPLVKQGA